MIHLLWPKQIGRVTTRPKDRHLQPKNFIQWELHCSRSTWSAAHNVLTAPLPCSSSALLSPSAPATVRLSPTQIHFLWLPTSLEHQPLWHLWWYWGKELLSHVNCSIWVGHETPSGRGHNHNRCHLFSHSHKLEAKAHKWPRVLGLNVILILLVVSYNTPAML